MIKVDTLDLLEIETQKAELLLHSGQSRAALDLYVNILQGRLEYLSNERELPYAADLTIMERVVDLSLRCGAVETTEKLLTAMIGFCTIAKYQYGIDYLLTKRAQIALSQGNLTLCRENLRKISSRIGALEEITFSEEALKNWEMSVATGDMDIDDKSVFFIAIYLLLGEYLCALGQYGSALAAFQAGLIHTVNTTPDKLKKSSIQIHLAISVANLEAGNTSSVRQFLDQTEKEIDPHIDLGLRATWLETNGHLALIVGNFGVAIQNFEDLVSMCQEGGFDRAALFAMMNLAQTLILLNQTSRARTILAKIKNDINIDPNISKRAEFLINLAEARGQSLAEGVPISPSVTEMWQGKKYKENSGINQTIINPLDLPQAPGYLTFFEDRALAFQWLLAKRNLLQAQKVLENIKESFQTTDSKLIHMRIGMLYAQFYYFNKQYQEANDLLTSLESPFEIRGLKPELWQLLRILGWCKIALACPREDFDKVSQLSAKLLNEITESLDKTSKSIYLLNKWTSQEEQFAGWIDQLIILKNGLEKKGFFARFIVRMSLFRSISEFCDKLDEYRKNNTIDSADANFSKKKKQGIMDCVSRLFNHSIRKYTIVFFVLPDRVLVVLSGFFKLDFGVCSLTRVELRNLISRWHELVNKTGESRDIWDIDEVNEKIISIENEQHFIGTKLSHLLQLDQILSSLPKRIQLLRIVPDDSLHGISFAALPFKEDAILKRVATVLAYESREYEKCKPRKAKGYRLIAGVSHVEGFRPLPGVAKEMLKIVIKLARRGECITLLDNEANKSYFLSLLPNSEIVHIACHGFFNPDQPDSSGLVLVNQTNQPEILTLRDISTYDLSNIRHITLSSCWSADSFIMPGKIIISLPEAFYFSGVGSVLASLWPVDDQFAILFMTRFYELLNQMTRIEALRKAQIECKEGKVNSFYGRNTSSPYYWAGFILYGDDGKLLI